MISKVKTWLTHAGRSDIPHQQSDYILYCQLRSKRKIQAFPNSKHSKRHYTVYLIISRLDCCNSTLWGLPAERLNRVQKMQNAAARVLARIDSTDRNHYTSPAVSALVSFCKPNQYKILAVTCLCGPGNAPQYLRELVSPYHPPRSLHSSS